MLKKIKNKIVFAFAELLLDLHFNRTGTGPGGPDPRTYESQLEWFGNLPVEDRGKVAKIEKLLTYIMIVSVTLIPLIIFVGYVFY